MNTPTNTTPITLGCIAKDKISGFQGVVVGVTQWLNSCIRYTICPQELKDGKPIDGHSFDDKQCEYVGPGPIEHTKETGGPAPEPTRNPDPR